MEATKCGKTKQWKNECVDGTENLCYVGGVGGGPFIFNLLSSMFCFKLRIFK